MKVEYVITNEELSEKGLDLNDYALDGTYINAIIQRGLNKLVNEMCYFGDLKSSSQIETYLSTSDERTSGDKVEAFKEAQYLVIYNMLMINDSDPFDDEVQKVIVYQLGLKINGFQKGIFNRRR
jgi:hypothetical protein